MKLLQIFFISCMLATGFTACKDSNSTTQETPEDMDDSRNDGDPGNQSHSYGTSNGYDDDHDTSGTNDDEIEHNHE